MVCAKSLNTSCRANANRIAENRLQSVKVGGATKADFDYERGWAAVVFHTFTRQRSFVDAAGSTQQAGASMMTTYYLCTPDYSHNWAAVWRTGGVYPAKCSACRSYISERPGGGWEPLRVKIPPGKRHGDVYHYIYDLLVNEHAKQVLSEYVREGMSFVEAQIVYPAGTRLWSVEISNRCAMHLDCGVELVRVCPQCGYREYSTWDGGIRIGDCAHDIFRLTEDPSWVIVSEPLKQKLEAAKLKNLVFVDASTMHDEFAWMRPQRKRHSGSENH